MTKLNLLKYIHNETVNDSLTKMLADSVKQASESKEFEMVITREREMLKMEKANQTLAKEIQEYKKDLQSKDDRIEELEKEINRLMLKQKRLIENQNR
ncbi:MAG: hypothetical protein Q3982_06165 [Phoenicibacter congonensis]|uniref:Uncharacterized protein n=1 Tax=Phoenicibacter congonensis TaxID=1944646 RepID=A0AA43UAE3_9ACTN|nr:hypothetical protein [Phoenicibacter congonensis]